MLILDEPVEGLWERFEQGTLSDEELDVHPVVRRWIRARRARMGAKEPGRGDVPRVLPRRASPLTDRAAEAFESASVDLQRLGYTTLLADRDGIILASRGLELLSDPQLRAALADGMSMNEADRGTNAIGTALAEARPIAVLGRAHSDVCAHALCCYAALIRDPRGRIIAALAIAGALGSANPLLGFTVESLAATLEAKLRLVKAAPEPDEEAELGSGADLKLSAIVETLPVAVWVADAEGNITLSNQAARDLWGGEIRPPRKDWDRFKAWWPDGRRLAAEDWGLSKALTTGKVFIDNEVKIETFDGRHKIIRNSAAPIFDRGGRIVGGVAVNEDITFLKGTEATRDLFTGILSHDLRNPLSAIVMAAVVLSHGGGLNDAQLKTVARIQSSARRIQRLVDDLLDFTRARFGMGFPLKPVRVDLGEIAAGLVDELRTAHPERVVRFERRGDVAGEWDPARVSQVVSNLLGNAVAHGQDPLGVEVADAGDVVTLAVSNGGPAISESTRASLFEPFRKGPDSKGIGLGLFIAHELLRAHGGSLEVTSDPARTTFTARWPRVRPK